MRCILEKKLMFCATLFLVLGMCTLIPELHTKAFSLDAERNYGEWICVKNADGTLTVTGYRALEQLTRGVLEIPSTIDGMLVTGVGGECTSSYCKSGESTCEHACFHAFSPELVKELILPDTIVNIFSDGGYSIFRQFTNLKKLQLPNNDFYIDWDWVDTDIMYFPCLEEVTLRHIDDLPDLPNYFSQPQPWAGYSGLKKLTFYEGVTEIKCKESFEMECDVRFPDLLEIDLPSTVQVFEWRDSPKLSILNCPKDLSSVCIYKLVDCPNLHIAATVDMGVDDCWDSWGFYNSGVTEINLKNVPEKSGPLSRLEAEYTLVGYEPVSGCNDLTAINVISGTSNSILSSQDGILFYKDYLVRYPAGKSAVSNYTLPESCLGFSAIAFDDCKITSITIPEHIKDFLLLYWQYSETSSFFNGKFKLRVINGQCGFYDNWTFSCGGKLVKAEYYWGSNYAISYNLNGGTNAPENPTSYRAGDNYIELNNPTRPGYTFLGWKRNDVTGYESTTKNRTGFKDFIFTAEWQKGSSIGTVIPDILGGIYKVTGTGLEVQFVKSAKSNAKSVTIPNTIQANGNTYKVTSIAPNAFKNNKEIISVTIGNKVKTIGSNAFSGCKKLKKITLGFGVTSIKARAFCNCLSLTKIIVPQNVSQIGKQAFNNCTNLKSIIIRSEKLTTRSIGAKAFSKINKKAAVKVPKKVLKAYKKLLRKKGLPSSAKIKK